MNHPAALPAHALCENCSALLHGEFCHQCGQSIHNPVRHAGHAIEEVFESFWHLDGRLWRTLRDLMVPGRTALEYLAGHRQRYMPPLRLFVVMSLLAFFVGRLAIHFDEAPITDLDVSSIIGSQSAGEVERNRDRLLDELEDGRRKNGRIAPGVDPALIRKQVKIRAEAANRIDQLTRDKSRTPSTSRPSSAGTPAGVELLSTDNQAFDPEANPVRIGWLPDFANRWLTRQAVHVNENVTRMENRPDRWFQAFMTSLPSALFVLVPVFALMLKVAYLFKRRLYMEHLVVALYSHVFLLVALTAVFLLMAIGGWAGSYAPWLSWVSTIAIVAVLAWMPLYLLLMQKSVYAQGWPLTLVKYSVIGYLYLMLLAFVAGLMFVVTLAKG
ncbi:MAG: DUF3667 domain-containing protein [Pseudoxanthomonas sp.]